MPSAPKLRATRGVLRRVGVGAHAHRAELVDDLHELLEPRVLRGVHHRQRAVRRRWPLVPFSVIDVAFLERHARRPSSSWRPCRSSWSPAPTMQHLPQPRATSAAWLVMPPRAVRMPCGRAHAFHVLGVGLFADQDHLSCPAWPTSTASAEVKTILPQAPPGPAGRPDTNASAFFSAAGSTIGCSSSSSWAGCDAHHGGLLVDQLLVQHVHGHVQGRGAGPLAVAALEHVELAFLDRELDVLHVLVVLLELGADVVRVPCTAPAISVSSDVQVLVLLVLGRFVQRVGRADAGHHVFALGVDQPLAVELVLAGGRVAA